MVLLSIVFQIPWPENHGFAPRTTDLPLPAEPLLEPLVLEEVLHVVEVDILAPRLLALLGRVLLPLRRGRRRGRHRGGHRHVAAG